MISLNSVNYFEKENEILKNVTLDIMKNNTTVIMGKNGSGKSTLLNLINKIYEPSSGSITSELAEPIPMLFQKPIMFERSVNYNYLLLHKIKKFEINNYWFNCFQLNKIKNQSAKSLSGGEKQKLFLSRLMSFNQKNLFLDEPNQNLDLESEKLLIKLLKKEKISKTIVMTLHNFEIAKNIADNIIYLDQGRVLYNLKTADFFKTFKY
tara:strand:+ start:563 stop:1186 length:624 start_codon:yes stop_codon:yes gene_type:complete